jgi:hypothetical protein
MDNTKMDVKSFKDEIVQLYLCELQDPVRTAH